MRLFAFLAALAFAGTASADAEFTLTIREHKFEPAELKVPAGQKIRLIVVNEDDSAEEFESNELNREKIVAPKGRITVIVGPLEPGRYPYFGEFHMDTALGTIIAE